MALFALEEELELAGAEAYISNRLYQAPNNVHLQRTVHKYMWRIWIKV